jgi:probable rRNA maturation factor
MKIMKINIVNYFNNNDYSQVVHQVTNVASTLLHLEEEALTVIFVTNVEIRKMNMEFRNKDYATDVLTFADGSFHHLGDVIISLDKCIEQAKELNHSFERELGFLVVHGLLHTLGYDHQTKEEEAEMNELQQRILHKAKLYR